MSTPRHPSRYADLQRIAVETMTERGLRAEFSPAVQQQVGADPPAAGPRRERAGRSARLLWCSIDNDDSRDLDQLSVAEALPEGATRVWVAIADVDSRVPRGSPIDEQASFNTTSVYTSARIFPMLPEALCYDLSSLNPGVDRLAVVTEMVVAPTPACTGAHLPRAFTTTRSWPMTRSRPGSKARARCPRPPPACPAWTQLRLQDQVAQCLRQSRHAQGSLALETFQPRAVFDAGRLVGIEQQVQNRARQLIEELMIATNTCTALLAATGARCAAWCARPSAGCASSRWRPVRRTVARQPRLARAGGLSARRHAADPLRFPDLSLVIVKLMGSGEYVVERAGQRPIGHFGLALRDYTHSTAPNRRYPDLITQRMVKAALAGEPMPYSDAELQALAGHCTRQEDASRKVERKLRKCEAALYLEKFLGQRFEALVTGTDSSATWVRLLSPPVEGRLIGRLPRSASASCCVELRHTDVERGFIDFVLLAPRARTQAMPATTATSRRARTRTGRATGRATRAERRRRQPAVVRQA
jgi:exoribonuclease-2